MNESTAVPQEQVVLGRALMALHGFIPPFVARIVPGHIRPGQWTRLAEMLEAAAARCRQQDEGIVIEQAGEVVDGSIDGDLGTDQATPGDRAQPHDGSAAAPGTGPAPRRLPFSNSGP